MRAVLKGSFSTSFWLLFAVLVSTLLYLEVSQGWGGFLFLFFTIFIGVPLSGRGERRGWRPLLFGTATIGFGAFVVFAMPYDPFGEAEPIAAVFTGKTHSKEFWSEVSESNTPAVEVYSLYEENGQGYWLYGERAVGQPRWREGFFVSVPRSERSWFLESYHEKDREPDPTWKVGYVLQGVDATSAIGRRNLAFVGLLVFWIVVFVLEEGRFQRRRKKRPTPSG